MPVDTAESFVGGSRHLPRSASVKRSKSKRKKRTASSSALRLCEKAVHVAAKKRSSSSKSSHKKSSHSKPAHKKSSGVKRHRSKSRH